MQHLKLSLLLCRMVCDIQPFEQLLEVVLLVDVVIRLQHVEEEALAEAARTYQEKEVACPLHLLKEHGFVDQVFIFLP